MKVTQEQLLALSEDQYDKLIELLGDNVEFIDDLNMFIAGLLPAACIEIPDDIYERV